MKFRVVAYIEHEMVDEFETDSLEEARSWWKKHWKKAEDLGKAFCEWYTDGKHQSLYWKIRLEEGGEE